MWNTFRRGEQCPKVELPTRAQSHAPLYLQTSRIWKVAGIRKFTGIYIRFYVYTFRSALPS